MVLDYIIEFTFYDENNQKVVSISEKSIEAKIIDSSENKIFNLYNKYRLSSRSEIKILGNYNPLISEGYSYKQKYFLNFCLGKTSISGLSIFTNPSSSFSIQFFYSSILLFKNQRRVIKKRNEFYTEEMYSVIFTLNFRECILGEVFISSLYMYNLFFPNILFHYRLN